MYLRLRAGGQSHRLIEAAVGAGMGVWLSVLFGSVIVAAYKMGMVHERSTVSKASTFQQGGSQAMADEPDTEGVLEIRNEKPVIELG